VGLGALVIEFRERIALALAVALLLAFVQRQGAVTPRLPELPSRLARGVHSLGQASYALFLVHFPVLMLGNALFAQWAPAGAWAVGAGLLGSWAVSMGLALVFERWVEKPLSTLGKRPATPLSEVPRARG
jgi:peptidoglycan/LPS O-acetylase OafA/YrhL